MRILKNQFNRYLLILSILLTPALSNNLAAQYKISKVVIDAGHGGRDPGAIGFFSQEKDIALNVSLRLGKMLQDSTKGKIKAIYTRTTDIYPPLPERHRIANDAEGEIFVSIHINATAARKETIKTGTKKVKVGKKKYKEVPVYKTIYHKETATNGTETYVLGLHRMDQKEKAIANYGEIQGEESGLLNIEDPTTAIIITQYSQRFLSKSVTLANKIQTNFRKQGRQDFGVKQKGLEVLAGSAMPGVLVEIGFINNRSEEQYMNSPEGIEEIAHAIFRGIIEYAGG